MSAVSDNIVRASAQVCGVPVHAMLGDRRHRAYIRAREVCVMALRSAGFSFPEIGAAMDGGSHGAAVTIYSRVTKAYTNDRRAEILGLADRAAELAATFPKAVNSGRKYTQAEAAARLLVEAPRSEGAGLR